MNLPFGWHISKREQNKPQSVSAPSQTREPLDGPFSKYFNSYQPLKCNIELFRVIRESCPWANIAVLKRIKLIGDFTFETYGKQGLLDKMNDFKQNVKVNSMGTGVDTYLVELEDSTFCDGYAVGEIIPLKSMTGIHRLKTCNSLDFRFVADKETGLITLGIHKPGQMEPEPIENMDLITYLTFDQRRGNPQGYSLFYSLPFVYQILMRMEQSWSNSAWRVGDPTFFSLVKGGKGQTAEEVNTMSSALADQVANVMSLKHQGQTGDLRGGVMEGGDVTITTLGADGKPIVEAVPVRSIEEQFVSALDIPPYMLGLSWSTTERMAIHLNDMAVSNAKWERKRVNHIIRQVMDTFLTLTGDAGAKWDIIWDEVNLFDEEYQARARNLNAMALYKTVEAIGLLLDRGFINAGGAEELLRQEGLEAKHFPEGWYKEQQRENLIMKMAKEFVE